jgi:hypothetical protein
MQQNCPFDLQGGQFYGNVDGEKDGKPLFCVFFPRKTNPSDPMGQMLSFQESIVA